MASHGAPFYLPRLERGERGPARRNRTLARGVLSLSTSPPSLSFPPLRAGAKVTLFEKEATFGGHTLTDDSLGYPVDLGFQVRRQEREREERGTRGGEERETRERREHAPPPIHPLLPLFLIPLF
jgi:hypothetical protein